MSNRPALDDLAALSAIAHHRSFRRAADELGVSRSALSHTVRALEARLGVSLLRRTTRSVAPTEAGTRLLDRLRPLLDAFDAALGEVAAGRDEATGTVRINTSAGAADLLLDRIVPVFMARHPAASLELVTDEGLVDIVAEGFDAGVRLIEAVPRDMIAIPFGGPARFVSVASPAYLARHPAPRTPQDLHAHACLRFRLRSGRLYRWEFARHGQEVAVDVPGALTLDQPRLMLQAAIAGLGIAFGPERLSSPYVAQGALLTVLDDWCPRWPGLCVYYPRHRHMTAALRAFLDVVRATDAPD